MKSPAAQNDSSCPLHKPINTIAAIVPPIRILWSLFLLRDNVPKGIRINNNKRGHPALSGCIPIKCITVNMQHMINKDRIAIRLYDMVITIIIPLAKYNINPYLISMLEQLKQTLEKKYKLRDTKGLFISCFDAQWKLLCSQWAVESDKPLEETLQSLYTSYIEPLKNVKVVTLDVVTNLFEETNIGKIPTTSPKMYGFALVDDHGTAWMILPGTKWVADAKHALYLMKQKYTIQGKVKIYVFTTDRLIVTN